jgi:hypothetical protein
MQIVTSFTVIHIRAITLACSRSEVSLHVGQSAAGNVSGCVNFRCAREFNFNFSPDLIAFLSPKKKRFSVAQADCASFLFGMKAKAFHRVMLQLFMAIVSARNWRNDFRLRKLRFLPAGGGFREDFSSTHFAELRCCSSLTFVKTSQLSLELFSNSIFLPSSVVEMVVLSTTPQARLKCVRSVRWKIEEKHDGMRNYARKSQNKFTFNYHSGSECTCV